MDYQQEDFTLLNLPMPEGFADWQETDEDLAWREKIGKAVCRIYLAVLGQIVMHLRVDVGWRYLLCLPLVLLMGMVVYCDWHNARGNDGDA